MKSRYIALTQQPYCCVPTCLQMIMYRRELPLIEQEELGYALGLAVPEKARVLFPKALTQEPSSGWGTQIQNAEYSLDKAFEKLGIPLKAEFILASQLDSTEILKERLQTADPANDTVLCFSYGALWGTDSLAGHASLFDYVDGEEVWMVDPVADVPKHRRTSIDKLFNSIQKHGDQNQAGLWVISSK